MASSSQTQGAAMKPPQTQNLPLQEIGVVLVVDTSITVADTWIAILNAHILPMLQNIMASHQPSLNPPYAPKLRVGLVTFNKASIDPPIVCNNYFTPYEKLFKDMSRNLLSYGFALTNAGGPCGMAVLEGLVAAIEMCDVLLRQTTKHLDASRRPRHPSLPPVPPTNKPIFHIFLVGAGPPGGSPSPRMNNNHALDETTMETVADELIKRDINLSVISPNPVPEFITLHKKITEAPEAPWFKTAPGFTVLLSGFQSHPPSESLSPMARRPSSTDRSLAATSPASASSPAKHSAQRPGQLAIPPFDPKSVLPATSDNPNTQPGVQPEQNLSQLAAQQAKLSREEYQRMMVRAHAPHSQIQNPSPSDTKQAVSDKSAKVATHTDVVNVNYTAGSASEPSEPQPPGKAPSDTNQVPKPTPPIPPLGPPFSMSSTTDTSLEASKSDASASQSQSTQTSLPATLSQLSRPQSQPQHMSPPTPQQIQNASNKGHYRSQSGPLMFNQQTPDGGGRASPLPNPPLPQNQVLQQSPLRAEQHLQRAEWPGSTPDTSPNRPQGSSSNTTADASSSPLTTVNPPQLPPAPQGVDPLAAQSQYIRAMHQQQALQAGNAPNTSLGTANMNPPDPLSLTARHNILKAHLAAQMIAAANQANNKSAPTPQQQPPQSELPSSSGSQDAWLGSISWTVTDLNFAQPPKELIVWVSAKCNIPANSTQSSLWPKRLAYNNSNLRTYDIGELGGTIKSNSLSIWVFSPHQPPGKELDIATNDKLFKIFISQLSMKQYGVAIPFPVIGGPQGTGMFLFAPPGTGNNRVGERLLGVAFLAKPLPNFPQVNISGASASNPPSTNQTNTSANTNPNAPFSSLANPTTNHPPTPNFNAGNVNLILQGLGVNPSSASVAAMGPAERIRLASVLYQHRLQQNQAGNHGAQMNPLSQPQNIAQHQQAQFGAIPPQAQAQNRVLSGGFGNDPSGMGGGLGGFLGGTSGGDTMQSQSQNQNHFQPTGHNNFQVPQQQHHLAGGGGMGMMNMGIGGMNNAAGMGSMGMGVGVGMGGVPGGSLNLPPGFQLPPNMTMEQLQAYLVAQHRAKLLQQQGGQ